MVECENKAATRMVFVVRQMAFMRTIFYSKPVDRPWVYEIYYVWINKTDRKASSPIENITVKPLKSYSNPSKITQPTKRLSHQSGKTQTNRILTNCMHPRPIEDSTANRPAVDLWHTCRRRRSAKTRGKKQEIDANCRALFFGRR